MHALATTTHAVQPGDTLWSIADDHTADGADWTAIAALNLGRDMTDGSRFVDPDHLRPGWRLHVPLAAVPGEAAGGRSRTGASAHFDEHLPELIALGLGSIACAALARRARRRRVDPFTGDLDLGVTLSEEAVDAAALLHRFDGVPALRSFEVANCLLGWSLRDDLIGAAIRAICVSPSGVTFWLREPRTDAPHGFVSLTDGMAWHVAHDALPDHVAHTPHVPLALPIGDDEEGTWLVALRAGDVLPLLGESAPSLLRAARSAVSAWDWSDMILVSAEPDDPGFGTPARAGAPHRLFFGDPRSLPLHAVHTAVVTTATVAASDLTVLVDRKGATLHPMGKVVRPWLQSPETSRRIAELTAPAADPHPDLGSPAVSAVAATRADVSAGAPDHLEPGAVEVRLLTMNPRLEGLCEDLPPNRARRAVELVAYLALHQPDVITGDRLRTRVLGSSDSDAAAKTLFNTADAARRAMGIDERGEPLFPAGSRGGLYQVSPRVTVDVRRAIALAAQGASLDDPALGDRALPSRPRTGRGRTTRQRPLRILLVGSRRPRRAHRVGAGRRRLLLGGVGGRRGALRARPLGPRARPSSRALQRGPLARCNAARRG